MGMVKMYECDICGARVPKLFTVQLSGAINVNLCDNCVDSKEMWNKLFEEGDKYVTEIENELREYYGKSQEGL